MDAMASATADANDIDEAIKMGGNMALSEAGIDESELEDELQALIGESEREKEDYEETQKEARLKQVEMQVPIGDPQASSHVDEFVRSKQPQAVAL